MAAEFVPAMERSSTIDFVRELVEHPKVSRGFFTANDSCQIFTERKSIESVKLDLVQLFDFKVGFENAKFVSCDIISGENVTHIDDINGTSFFSPSGKLRIHFRKTVLHEDKEAGKETVNIRVFRGQKLLCNLFPKVTSEEFLLILGEPFRKTTF